MCQQWDVLPYITVFLVLIAPWVFAADSSFRYYGKFVAYYGITSFFAIFLIPVFMLTPRDVGNSRRSTYITRHVAKLIGVRFKLEDGHILSEDRGAFIVSNHQTTLDILGLFNIWEVPNKVAAIAKKEVFYVWPFGLAAWLGGVVFIDRSSPAKSYQTLKETSKLIETDKVKIWLFPEGTRNKEVNMTRELLKFKRGAFKMAVDCQAPIIPVVFSPYYFMDRKTKFFGQGEIIIKPLPAIPTAGLTDEDINDLMSTTHKVMQTAFEELCTRVETSLPPTHPFTIKYQNRNK